MWSDSMATISRLPKYILFCSDHRYYMMCMHSALEIEEIGPLGPLHLKNLKESKNVDCKEVWGSFFCVFWLSLDHCVSIYWCVCRKKYRSSSVLQHHKKKETNKYKHGNFKFRMVYFGVFDWHLLGQMFITWTTWYRCSTSANRWGILFRNQWKSQILWTWTLIHGFFNGKKLK